MPFLPATFASCFRIRGFSWLWLCSSFSTLGVILSLIGLAWTVLELTNSNLMVGLALAARFAPALIFGLQAGFIADLFDRRRVLVLANLGAAIVGFLVGFIALSGGNLLLILLVALAWGVFDALRTTSSQALVYDTVGAEKATSGIALTLLAGQLLGIPAGLLGGALLNEFGAAACFVLVGITYLIAALAVLPVHSNPIRQRLMSRDVKEIARLANLVTSDRSIAFLALLVALTEVFAFSSTTLLATFARDVFSGTGGRLGLLFAARAIGGTAGLLALANLPLRYQRIPLLFGLCISFGVVLILFALIPDFAIALGISILIGVMMASVDALAQSLLQHRVSEDQRGSAIGIWLLSTGLGPVGDLEIGALATAWGAQYAQAINGAVLILLIVIARLTNKGRINE